MSDTSNDTSAIDEKKEQDNSANSSSTFASKIVQYIFHLIFIILVVLLYFYSSGLVLFVTKLAQSNILPTDENCTPYTDYEPNIKPIKTNIFSTSDASIKLEFPYYDNDNNIKNIILDTFNEYKNKSSSNFLANYFISITESLMLFDYSAISSIMNFFNELPEIVTILFGPIVVGISFTLLTLINQLYFIYLFFVKMSWFFKENNNNADEGKPKWDDISFVLSPFDWWLGVGLVILFIILFFIGLPLLTFIPFIALFYCTFSTVMYKGLLNDKLVSAFSIATKTLSQYKLPIVSIISFFVVSLAFANLGIVPGVFSIIVLLFIYFGMLSINLFNPPQQQIGLTPLVSNSQAKRSCPNKGNKDGKHGFLYNLLLGQSGGNITNEIKKIGKNLSVK